MRTPVRCYLGCEAALLYSVGESQIPQKALPDRRDGLHFPRLPRAYAHCLSAQRQAHEGSLPVFEYAPARYQGSSARLCSRCF